jgi:ankyrin
LKNGSNPLKQDKKGMTPVGVAALKGFLHILHIIFRWHTEDALHTMSGNLVYTSEELLEVVTDRDGLNLLHLAVQSGNVEVIAYLIHQRVNTRARMKDGSTTMHLACKGGILQIVKLLASDSWLIHAGNFNNITPLHVATRYNQHEVLEYLLSQNANPEDLTIEGLTGLLVASSFGALAAVDVLIRHNVYIKALDEDERTVLHYAVGNTRVLNYLTEV